MPSLHFEVLSETQRRLLPKIRFLKEKEFYLAGGTGLTLHLKHRSSIDFDFYNPSHFDTSNLLYQFQKEIEEVILIQSAENTLSVRLNGVETSLFTYPYHLLNSLIKAEYIDIASLEDIAAMKLIAIIQRGNRRDFLDIYFLIKKLGLKEIIFLSKEKYPPFNQYAALQALIYFEDAEREDLSEREIKMFREITWKEVKGFIIQEVRKLREELG